MANLPGAPTRTVRVPDDLWHGALSATDRAGETVADVINRALVDYVNSPPREGSRRVDTKQCPECGKTVGRNGRGAARHMNKDSKWCAGSGQ
jgi:hypothetical protein